MRKALRANSGPAWGVLAHTVSGFFQRVDGGQRNCRLRLGQMVLHVLLDIALRPLAKDDRIVGQR